MADGDGNNSGGNGNGGGGSSERMFTQADVDRIVADRLRRTERQYGGEPEHVRQQLAEAAEMRSQIGQLQKAVTDLTGALTAERTTNMRREVAEKYHLPKSFAARLDGKTREELDAAAKEMADELKAMGLKLGPDAGNGGKDGGDAGGGKDGGGADGAAGGNGENGKDGKGGSGGSAAGGSGGSGDQGSSGTGGGESNDGGLFGRPKESLRSGAVPSGGNEEVDYAKEADAILSGNRFGL